MVMEHGVAPTCSLRNCSEFSRSIPSQSCIGEIFNSKLVFRIYVNYNENVSRIATYCYIVSYQYIIEGNKSRMVI